MLAISNGIELLNGIVIFMRTMISHYITIDYKAGYMIAYIRYITSIVTMVSHFILDTSGYTNWSKWSRCSNQCGIGVQVRSRKCRVTDLRYKAKYCTKQTTIRRMCFERNCYKKS